MENVEEHLDKAASLMAEAIGSFIVGETQVRNIKRRLRAALEDTHNIAGKGVATTALTALSFVDERSLIRAENKRIDTLKGGLNWRLVITPPGATNPIIIGKL